MLSIDLSKILGFLCACLLLTGPARGLQEETKYIVDSKGLPIVHALVKIGIAETLPVDENGGFHVPSGLDVGQKLEIYAMGYDTRTLCYAEIVSESKIVLREKIGQLGEVVVAATRTDRSVEDLPMPVTVVSQEMIRETGGLRLSEVLREQTGLQVVADHGNGLQMQGLSSDYILILLDGEPLIGRTAGTFDLDRISVSNIERIEILRGPSSAIYGSEAMAGVINIITKKSSDQLSAVLESRYRSFRTTDLLAQFGINHNDWEVLAYLNRFSTRGFDLNPEAIGQTQAPFRAKTAQVKLGRKIGEKWKAGLNSRFYREESDNLLAVSQDGESLTVELSGTREDLNFNPSLSYKPSEKWLWTLRGMSAVFRTYSTSRFQESGDLLEEGDFKQFYHRTELQTDFLVNKAHLLTLGTGHLVETVEATRYDDLNRFDAAYLFVQHQWNPERKWNLVTGFRTDLHSQYGSRISPKISGLYKFTDHFSWQLSLGAGFKAPDFRQLLLNFNNASAGYYVFGANLVQHGIARLNDQGLISQILIDPSGFGTLKAERSMALNTGFRWKLTNDLLIQANLFRNQISNLIETAPVARLVSGQNAFSYFNVSRVATQGVELDVTYRIGDALRLSLGYMYLDTKDVDVLDRIDQGLIYKRDSQNRTTRVERSDYGGLFNRSRHSGNLKVNYREPFSRTDIALRGIYRGAFGFGDVNGNLILDDPSEYASGLISWNLTLAKELSNGILLELGGTNLLNSLNVYDPTNPGRTCFAGLRLPLIFK